MPGLGTPAGGGFAARANRKYRFPIPRHDLVAGARTPRILRSVASATTTENDDETPERRPRSRPRAGTLAGRARRAARLLPDVPAARGGRSGTRGERVRARRGARSRADRPRA